MKNNLFIEIIKRIALYFEYITIKILSQETVSEEYTYSMNILFD